VLHPAKLKLFVLLSVLMHIAFALLFAEVSLSFPPPQIQDMSLTILIQGKGRGDIVQVEAAWPMPERIEPEFSAQDTLKGFDKDIRNWTQLGMPDLSVFSPKDAIVPRMKTADFAAEALSGSSKDLITHIPAASKPVPIIDFALPPALPKIFEND
jgi:hypothetical protein